MGKPMELRERVVAFVEEGRLQVLAAHCRTSRVWSFSLPPAV